MTEQFVVIVDQNDRPIAVKEKIEAHRQGLLHRAFSIFIRNRKEKFLLQKRASGKYHSGGLWTNTCCGHAIPDEEINRTASRRLKEEMGFTCDFEHLYSFQYKVALDNLLTENEIDHVFIGTFNGLPSINTDEAEDYRWVSLPDIVAEIAQSPDSFTYWFKEIVSCKIFTNRFSESPQL